MTWTPATKAEVECAVFKERERLSEDFLALMGRYAVDPYPLLIERYGQDEQAFVVARSGTHVIYFDDVEEYFGTAREENGHLLDYAIYGILARAIRVFHYKLPHA